MAAENSKESEGKRQSVKSVFNNLKNNIVLLLSTCCALCMFLSSSVVNNLGITVLLLLTLLLVAFGRAGAVTLSFGVSKAVRELVILLYFFAGFYFFVTSRISDRNIRALASSLGVTPPRLLHSAGFVLCIAGLYSVCIWSGVLCSYFERMSEKTDSIQAKNSSLSSGLHGSGKRDKTIDRLRGLAMLWVIFVHVLYWGDFFDNSIINFLKSFCLFEMPLFFFVTGASNSFSRSSGYFRFVFRRLKRILIPYWVFAVIAAAVSIVNIRNEGIDFRTVLRILGSWLIPFDKQISKGVITAALWFLPVYLCVILLLPLLIRLKKRPEAAVFIFVFFALFAAACQIKSGLIRNTVFYSFWAYIGLFYSEIKIWLKSGKSRKILFTAAASGTAIITVLGVTGFSVDMQRNKFPPTLIFSIFSFVTMSLIFLLIPALERENGILERNKLIKKLVDLFSGRSLTVFLYQAFAFKYTIRLTNLLLSGRNVPLSFAKVLLCFAVTVPACALMAVIFGKIENIGVAKVNSSAAGLQRN